jgi:hypothetical protein
MKAKKLEPPLHLDMAFGEALQRYAQTKPEEVEPPPGKPRKGARPKPGAIPKAGNPSIRGDTADASGGGKPDGATVRD